MNRVILSLSILLVPMESQAEEFPEAPSSSDEFERGFGESSGIDQEELLSTENDTLSLGGRMSLEYSYLKTKGSELPDVFQAPNTLWLYLDSRLKQDARVFVKGRSTYDSTVEEGKTSPLTGETAKKTNSELEELKLNFQIAHTAFFTLGKQKIKWGSARVWNPSDILNVLRKDPLAPTDDRAGLSLVKVHLPWKDHNFYALVLLDDAHKSNQVGYAGRIELAISKAELALSGSGRKGRKNLFAADLSTAVWDIDIYGEASYSKGSDKKRYRLTAEQPGPFGVPNVTTEDLPEKAIVRAAGGIIYEYKYSDQDTLSAQVEYFYNEEGYGSNDDYLAVLTQNAYEPFYLGQRYAMALLYLPSPGSWENLTFSAMHIANLSDGSKMTRSEVSSTHIQDLTLSLAYNVRTGDRGGEFRYGGQQWEVTSRVSVSF